MRFWDGLAGIVIMTLCMNMGLQTMNLDEDNGEEESFPTTPFKIG